MKKLWLPVLWLATLLAGWDVHAESWLKSWIASIAKRINAITEDKIVCPEPNNMGQLWSQNVNHNLLWVCTAANAGRVSVQQITLSEDKDYAWKLYDYQNYLSRTIGNKIGTILSRYLEESCNKDDCTFTWVLSDKEGQKTIRAMWEMWKDFRFWADLTLDTNCTSNLDWTTSDTTAFNEAFKCVNRVDLISIMNTDNDWRASLSVSSDLGNSRLNFQQVIGMFNANSWWWKLSINPSAFGATSIGLTSQSWSMETTADKWCILNAFVPPYNIPECDSTFTHISRDYSWAKVTERTIEAN